MVAVTGTAGKTSVASFTRQIWAFAGHPAAQIGTTASYLQSRNDYGSLTTPDPLALHTLLGELVDEGVTHAAMEASSHGLDQSRLDGVVLSAAGFTNLGRDHMDYHPTVEDYMAAKMRLFDTLLPKGSPAVIYADDAWSDEAIRVANAAGHDVRTVGRKGGFLSLKRVEHFRHKQWPKCIMAIRFSRSYSLPAISRSPMRWSRRPRHLHRRAGGRRPEGAGDAGGASGRLDSSARPRPGRSLMSITPTSRTRWKTF